MSKIERLKKKIRKNMLYYQRHLDLYDCSENLALTISSTLTETIRKILEDIEELKQAELEINGKIPDVLLSGEQTWRAKLEA